MYDISIKLCGGIMIRKISKVYEEAFIEFLSLHNQKKECYIAWLPDNYEDLVRFNKESFYLCFEEGQIVGGMGIYLSIEQRVVRLLGPIIIARYFEKYADLLYECCLKDIPEDMKEVRIAFFDRNVLCRQWCEKHGFEQYNAERTMLYTSKRGEVPKQNNSNLAEILIRPFMSKDKEGLALVHPKGVFFTLDELIEELSDNNELLLLHHEGRVKGYVFYEVTSDKTMGEIILLHVKEGERGKGYGSILLEKAINNLEQMQVSEICINVRVDNEGAFRLYSRMGFMERDTIYAYGKSINA